MKCKVVKHLGCFYSGNQELGSLTWSRVSWFVGSVSSQLLIQVGIQSHPQAVLVSDYFQNCVPDSGGAGLPDLSTIRNMMN